MAYSLPRCAWLVSEGLKFEEAAAKLDCGGSSAEACIQHRRAHTKLNEAASLCPPGHADKDELQRYADEISLRIVYLESLGSASATLPLEDHIGEISLTMDLSSAEAPIESVEELLARSGASGSSSALDESGYKMVAALRSDDEMKIYIKRILAAEGRQMLTGSEAHLDAFIPDFSGTRGVADYASLWQGLLNARWVDIILDPSKDKLEMVALISKEAQRLEETGRKEDAVKKYSNAVAILGFIISKDPRSANPRVKEMLITRQEELNASIKRLS